MNAYDSAPTPTIGRIVWHRGKDGNIRPAVIVRVHGKWCVDVYVIPSDLADLESGFRSSVTHADPAQEASCFPSWHWMPYQLGQAARTIEAEAKAAASFVRPLAPEEVSGLLAEADHAEKTGANGGMVLLTPVFMRRVLQLLERADR